MTVIIVMGVLAAVVFVALVAVATVENYMLPNYDGGVLYCETHHSLCDNGHECQWRHLGGADGFFDCKIVGRKLSR